MIRTFANSNDIFRRQYLKDFEKGMSNRDVAAQYGVPKGTLSTWIKSKEKHLDSLEKGRNIK